jgi:transposase-like protein
VCQDIENQHSAEKEQTQLEKGTPMPQRTEHRRHHALDKYLADDKIEDICRHLACSKSWLYKWRARYDATNLAWAQERSTRPKHSPTQTPEHVEQAIVSLHRTLCHKGTGGTAAIIRALVQQGIAPVPSRRTIYRIIRRHYMEV